MKRTELKLSTALLMFLLSATILFASDEKTTEALDPKTGFPVITDKPFIMFNEGITSTQITRIVYQTDYNRSNLVYQDYMVGVYCGFITKNMMPLNSTIRIAAYYPVYYTFNGMQQTAKQMFLYGIDLFAGPVFQSNMWQYVRINIAPGLHFLYEVTDNWAYINLGGGFLAGAELPLARHWTILVDGYFSLDYGNFGSNQKMMPCDIVWQYQLDVGFRFSIKGANIFSYINSRAK
jgi:hypothetical protein